MLDRVMTKYYSYTNGFPSSSYMICLPDGPIFTCLPVSVLLDIFDELFAPLTVCQLSCYAQLYSLNSYIYKQPRTSFIESNLFQLNL